jgi:hypothetical protein
MMMTMAHLIEDDTLCIHHTKGIPQSNQDSIIRKGEDEGVHNTMM